METPQSDQYLVGYVQEALAILHPRIKTRAEGLPRDEAEAILQDHEFEPIAVDEALHRLLQKGYLYEVDGHLRATLSEQEHSS